MKKIIFQACSRAFEPSIDEARLELTSSRARAEFEQARLINTPSFNQIRNYEYRVHCIMLSIMEKNVNSYCKIYIVQKQLTFMHIDAEASKNFVNFQFCMRLQIWA